MWPTKVRSVLPAEVGNWWRHKGWSSLPRVCHSDGGSTAAAVAVLAGRSSVLRDTVRARSRPAASDAATAATMRANQRRDTGPELRLRSALHRRGWRFQVDRPVDTGDRRVRPDIVFTRWRVAVFVDGCFWHSCPQHGQRPKANASFWDDKFRRNAERDVADTDSLQQLGWTVVRVWEHESTSDGVSAVEAALRATQAHRS